MSENVQKVEIVEDSSKVNEAIGTIVFGAVFFWKWEMFFNEGVSAAVWSIGLWSVFFIVIALVVKAFVSGMIAEEEEEEEVG